MTCFITLEQGGRLSIEAGGFLLLSECEEQDNLVLLGGKDYPFPFHYRKDRDISEWAQELLREAAQADSVEEVAAVVQEAVAVTSYTPPPYDDMARQKRDLREYIKSLSDQYAEFMRVTLERQNNAREERRRRNNAALLLLVG